MPLETWVSVGILIGVGVTLFVAMRSGFADLRAEFRSDIGGLRSEFNDLRSEFAGFNAEMRLEFAQFRSEVRADIKELRTELKADIAALGARVSELDRRVYALAVGLRPYVDDVPEGRTSGHTG